MRRTPAQPQPVAPPAVRPPTWRVWLMAARPQTLPVAAAPVVVGSSLAARAGSCSWPRALAALAGAVLLQVGANLVNDFADSDHGADGDDRLGPVRATQMGWLSRRQVVRGAAWAFGAAVLVGAYLTAVAGWPILVIGVTSLLAGIGYTAGRVRYGYRGLGEVAVFVFFGLVATGGSYFVHTGSLRPAVLLAGSAVGALTSAVLVVNNLRDRASDARAGKRTLAVRWGARAARVELCALLAVPFVSVGAGVAAGVLPRGCLWSLAAAPLALGHGLSIWRRDGAGLNPHLGGVARLSLVFAALLALGALP